MKINKTSWKILLLWTMVIALAGWAVWPHRSLKIQREFSLQNGRKMKAEMVLHSTWGWGVPQKIASLKVDVDGHEIPILGKAYEGVGPIDGARGVFIAESQGFPEVFVFGGKGKALERVMWKFMNYQFSERDLTVNHRVEIEYFADTPRLASAAMVPLGGTETPLAKPLSIGTSAIHSIPVEKVEMRVSLSASQPSKLSLGEAGPNHNQEIKP